MVDVINPVFNHSTQNHYSIKDDVANDMPPLSNRRPIFQTENTGNSNQNNNQLYNPKRYHKNNSPSNGSPAEAYLKSRFLFEPLFMHDEAATKYSMISKINTTNRDIRTEEMRYF